MFRRMQVLQMASADASQKSEETKTSWKTALIGAVAAAFGVQVSEFLGPIGWLPMISMGLFFLALWPLKLSQYRWSGLSFAGGQTVAIIAGIAIGYYLNIFEVTAWLLAFDVALPLALVLWAIFSRERLPVFVLLASEVFGIAMTYYWLPQLAAGDPKVSAWMHMAIRAIAIGLLSMALITREPARRAVTTAA
jgi:hypothetical protein